MSEGQAWRASGRPIEFLVMVASGDSLGLRQISARSILPLLSPRAPVRVLNDLVEILNNRV